MIQAENWGLPAAGETIYGYLATTSTNNTKIRNEMRHLPAKVYNVARNGLAELLVLDPDVCDDARHGKCSQTTGDKK
jgi:hypothetical protein